MAIKVLGEAGKFNPHTDEIKSGQGMLDFETNQKKREATKSELTGKNVLKEYTTPGADKGKLGGLPSRM